MKWILLLSMFCCEKPNPPIIGEHDYPVAVHLDHYEDGTCDYYIWIESPYGTVFLNTPNEIETGILARSGAAYISTLKPIPDHLIRVHRYREPRSFPLMTIAKFGGEPPTDPKFKKSQYELDIYLPKGSGNNFLMNAAPRDKKTKKLRRWRA